MLDGKKKDERVRIAYILKRFPRLSETFIANEILALERMNFDITIFSMKNPLGPVHSFVKEIRNPVHYLPIPSWWNLREFIVPHLIVAAKRPVSYLRCLRYALNNRSRESRQKFLLAGYISRIVISGDYRHLHSHFATGSTRLAKYVRLMTGVPFSFTAHAKDIFTDRVSRKQLRRRMKMAKFVVTISEFNRRYLESICGGVTIHVVRNGIPLDHFPPLNGNGRHESEEVPIVLSVGRFVEKKGFPSLIDAFAELKRRGVKCRGVIVGDGSLREEFEEQIDRLDLHDVISLEGSRTQDELVREYYRRAAIFALACREAENRDKDGIPVVLEEAMALGIPVVTTPVSGIPELVLDDDTGLLVPPDDPVELAGSIRRLLADRPLRDRLVKSARERIERDYDIEKSSRKLADLFLDSGEGN